MKIKTKLTLLGIFLLLSITISIIPVQADWKKEIEILIESEDTWMSDLQYWVAFSITESEIGDPGHRPYIMVSIESDIDDPLYDSMVYVMRLYNGTKNDYLNDRARGISIETVYQPDLIHIINIDYTGNYIVSFEQVIGQNYWFDAFVAIDLWYWNWIEDTTTTTTTTSEKNTTTTTTEKSNGITRFETVLVPFSVLVLVFVNRKRKK